MQINIKNCEFTEDLSMELIVIDEYPQDINTIKSEENLNDTIENELDQGVATYEYNNMVIKKIEIMSTESNMFRLKDLTARVIFKR